MKKSLVLLLVCTLLLHMTACGGGGREESDPNRLAVCLASEPETLDPALNSTVDGATLVSHLFSGLAKWSQDENGNLIIAPDAAEALPEGVKNADGTVTYTYTLREGMKWSDGQPVTAGDFVFAWNRAASVELAAGYHYLFDVIEGYAEIWAGEPGAKLNVTAIDDRTLAVTLSNPVPYWNELLAFPCYLPVREDVAAEESWATKPETYICNGMYTMESWAHNSRITLVRNPDHVDAGQVTMERLDFYLSDDTNNMLTNFENGSWKLIDAVPTNEIGSLRQRYPEEFKVVGQIGTYYVCWNVNETILPAGSTLTGEAAEEAEQEIRKAVNVLFDRNYIAEQIAQGGQVPASSFVAMGMTEPDGSQFYENTGYYDVSPEGYEGNFAAALQTLKQYYTYDEAAGKFTDFPSLTYLYNTSDSHKAIGEYIAGALGGLGITVNLVNQEWNTFLNTRKNGDYSIARNGWVADFNDPICFLDMWTADSGNNDVQFGKDGHGALAMFDLDLTRFGYDINVEDGTWAQTYDVLIREIKTCPDPEVRFKMMHLAEDMLMDTGAICPLYFNTDMYMIDSSVKGFYSNPLGYKFFMYCTVEG